MYGYYSYWIGLVYDNGLFLGSVSIASKIHTQKFSCYKTQIRRMPQSRTEKLLPHTAQSSTYLP